VKRCNDAINRSALLSSVGGPSASTTKVPAPRRGCNTPTAARELIPARNVGRLTQLAAMDHFAKLHDDLFETRAAPFGVDGLEHVCV
jgi:hypothetical protein